ncbi:hypothetical protein NHX12_002289 [Muraenolepis orangiensis]|uniref:Cytochrome P450 n=1 Tax=Muraenolepis orangiensis TaxID=630683 RepID=A0A9Q0E0K1_9TELE|nr:hypothetical protein NHX12_002289 [Muraenolepis orangiensis]
MFGSLVLFCLVLCLFSLLLRTRRGRNFPPGPMALPLLGNLLEFSAQNPIPDLNRLARRYGNVYSLLLGGQKAVVLNGSRALKEALVTKGADFSGRPDDLMTNHVWRDHRRFGLSSLRTFGLGKKWMEERILLEIQRVEEILEEGVGSVVNPQLLFHNLASNIISKVVFGSEYDHNHPFVYDTIPGIRYLPLPFRKAFQTMKEVSFKTLEVVFEHKKTKVQGEPRDLMDCYLDEMEKRGSSSFSEDQLSALAQDFHFAGTDTTSNTLLYALLYLMAHPHVQGIYKC